MKKKYKEPNLNISKVYTKVGDKGTTHLIGNEKVPKDANTVPKLKSSFWIDISLLEI